MELIKNKITLVLNEEENAKIINAENVLNQILDRMNGVDAVVLYSNACGIALTASEIEMMKIHLSVILEGDLEIE